MKMRTVITALLATTLLFVAGTSQARWMNPNNGRFQTMDSFEGVPTEPQTLHKYTYAHNDPVNRVDPSGHFSSGEQINVTGIQGLLARQILPSVVRVPGHIAARGTVGYAWIIAGIGAGVQTGYQHFSEAMREEARIRIRTRVEEQQRRQPGQILYHYTDWASAVSIASSGLIEASEAFDVGPITFPSGAYATDIPPWSTDYTQRQLSALFYGGVEHHPVNSFVAIRGEDFISLGYIGHPRQSFRPAPGGDYVPVRVITHGPNLMRP